MKALSLRILAAATLMCAAAPALRAQDSAGGEDSPGRFIDRKAEGWFWYKDSKDAPKPPAPKSSAPVAPKSSKPADASEEPFSAKWLQQNMPKLLERAIDSPNKENVEAYLYAQRVAMDKSQVYAESARRVVASDPFLDENNRVPLSTYAKPSFLKGVESGKTEALKHLTAVSGLWVFFDSKCEFCRPQIYSVLELARKHGFYTKFISLDGSGVPELKAFEKDNGMPGCST